MSDERNSVYASALISVAAAENDVVQVGQELFAVAQAVESDDAVKAALANAVGADALGKVAAALGNANVSSTTTALVSMVVAAGRGGDLLEISRAYNDVAATGAGKKVAEVRSAVELSDDQIGRLATALEQAVGHPVDVKVIIDPSVLGGLVTQIGDTVIDGSVRRSLTQMRESFA